METVSTSAQAALPALRTVFLVAEIVLTPVVIEVVTVLVIVIVAAVHLRQS